MAGTYDLTTAWQDLGVGPLQIQQQTTGRVLVAISAAEPANDLAAQQIGSDFEFKYGGTEKIWARKATSGTARIVVSPYEGAGAGGGGGGDASNAKLDELKAQLTTLLAKDFSTQATAAEILAKLIAAPATETTLAALLAKVIAAPATEANQSAGNATLASIDSQITTLRGLVDTLEALIGTTNATLTAVDGRVDGLEALLTTLGTYLDLVEAKLDTLIVSSERSADAAEDLTPVAVTGTTPRITGTLATPSTNSLYADGDHMANSGTAASVVPITFANAARVSGGSGRLTGCRATQAAGSGTIVLSKFDLLIFRPVTGVPFAAAGYPADNAALNVSLAAMNELVAIFSFLDTGWRNQAGGATAAGDHIYQAVTLASGRAFAPFNLASIPASDLLGICQARSAFNFGNIVNTFNFVLDTDQD